MIRCRQQKPWDRIRIGVAFATGRPTTRLPSDHSQVCPAKCLPTCLPHSSKSLAFAGVNLIARGARLAGQLFSGGRFEVMPEWTAGRGHDPRRKKESHSNKSVSVEP